MKVDSKIYVAGHQGLVGSAIVRALQVAGHRNIITRTHNELDLKRQNKVEAFFERERPEYVFLAAARVGGILANFTYPADFMYDNICIQTNVIQSAWAARAERLLFMGSSCIYPRECPQPMKEEHLLTGPLEQTNQPYALAKIAGVIQCEAYNRQHGTRFLAVMPTNLYGPNDNYDLLNSHVLPALIRKFHLAKLALQGEWLLINREEKTYGNIPDDVMGFLAAISRSNGYSPPADAAPALRKPAVILWGTGTPRREFLHADDLAEACLFVMNLPEKRYEALLYPATGLPLVNIGCGKDNEIRELAEIVARVIGFEGTTAWDTSKPDGTPRKLLDVSRLADLGWAPRINLEEGIANAYQWYVSKITS